MKNYAYTSDGERRRDFPGGFPGDAENKFKASGRTAQENEAFDLVRTLANFRLHSSALQTGNTMQYIPKDGVFVYFRYDKKQTVMVVLNSSSESKDIEWSRYHERTAGFATAKNITDNISFSFGVPLKIAAKSVMVLELQK
jgi:glycosidase